MDLFWAVNNNDIESLNRLIQRGDCDINTRNIEGYTPLHIAVEKDNIEIVNCLTNHTNCDINKQNDGGDTPLHIAVGNGNIEIVRCLTNHTNCDINKQNKGGDTPLHIAVLYDKIEIVRCLTNQTNCDINKQNDRRYTPLHTAVENDNIEIVRCLTNHTNCDINKQDYRRYTPLHIAVEKGNIEIVRCLTNHTNCDINKQDYIGYTPLYMAVEKGNIEIVKYLTNHTNCDINKQNNRGYTPLHIAVEEGNIEIVRCLTNHTDCDINKQGYRGYTPLYMAVLYDDIEIVRCLTNHTDCDINKQGYIGYTPLHIAVGNGNIEIVWCLINHTNCDINKQNKGGDTPLHIAVKKNKIKIVRYLIESGKCDKTEVFSTRYGLNFLHKIANSENVELFRVLIQHNIDVLTEHENNHLQLVEFILSNNDYQSLWFLITNGLYINSLTSSGENIVHLFSRYYMDYLYLGYSFLFDYGLDFNLLNNAGNSPLMVASLLNNLPFIQFLTDLSCAVNIQNYQGHTALHLCVIGFTLIKEKLNKMKVNSIVTELCAREFYPRYRECINILLSLGADVNIQDNNGKTVLMLACLKNDRTLLETLLKHGADVNIVDNHGRSALQYINLTSNVYDLACFNLLLARGCRQSFYQPWLNGNTIIQNVLQFSPLWQIDQTVNFIKYLVFKNVNLQLLTSDDGEFSYGQISLEEFSSQSRHELRQILYLSGGSVQQITQILHFEVEETLREKPREKFYLFANNLSLKDICRRVIRQNTGLAIHDRISELIDFPDLTDFLMFKDIDSERFSLPDQLESVIDDDYDVDYNSYDLNTENDDYNDDDDYVYLFIRFLFIDEEFRIDDDYVNDYLVYKDCKYLNEVEAGLKYPDLDSDSDSDSD